MASLDDLISNRNGIIRELLDLSDYVDATAEDMHPVNNPAAALKARFRKLPEIYARFTDAQKLVLARVNSREARQSQNEVGSKFEKVYGDTVNKYRELMKHSIAAAPVFRMPQFSGHPEAWLEFKNIGRRMLEENVKDNVQRLRCMKEAASGKAAELIRALQETDSNYSFAWYILERHYEQPVANNYPPNAPGGQYRPPFFNQGAPNMPNNHIGQVPAFPTPPHGNMGNRFGPPQSNLSNPSPMFNKLFSNQGPPPNVQSPMRPPQSMQPPDYGSRNASFDNYRNPNVPSSGHHGPANRGTMQPPIGKQMYPAPPQKYDSSPSRNQGTPTSNNKATGSRKNSTHSSSGLAPVSFKPASITSSNLKPSSNSGTKPSIVTKKVADNIAPKYDATKTTWSAFKTSLNAYFAKNQVRDDKKKLEGLRNSILIANRPITADVKSYSQAISLLDHHYEKAEPLRACIKNVGSCLQVKPVTVKNLKTFLKQARGFTDDMKYYLLDGSKDHLFEELIMYHVSDKLGKFEGSWKTEKDKKGAFPSFKEFYNYIILKCEEEKQKSAKSKSSGKPTSKSSKENNISAEDELSVISVVFGSKRGNDDIKEQRVKRPKLDSIPPCFICSVPHYVFKCSKFLVMSPAERSGIVKKHGICSICLRGNCEFAPFACKFKTPCEKCGKYHHSLLHVDGTSSTASAKQKALNEKCGMCLKIHRMKDCPAFLAMPWQDRIQAVEFMNVCLLCLRSNCDVISCPNKTNCLKCGSPHNTLLHPNV